MTVLTFSQFEIEGKSGDFYDLSGKTSSGGQLEEIENSLLKALELLKKGDKEKALTLLAEAMMKIKSGEELSIQQLVLCSEIGGYREYAKKEANTIKSSEPLLLYIEPAGYQIKKEGDEYNIWVSEDASIMNEKGDVIFQKNNWVEYKRGFMSPVIPFFITNRVTDIPPGKYTFNFTLKDHYKNSFLSDSFVFIVE
jgi:hypothetical protein